MKKMQFHKKPIILSVFLHLIIFALLFVHFTAKKPATANNVKVVQAIAVNESQLASQSATPTQNVATPPLPLKSIRQIEQIALKQPQEKMPVSKPLAPKSAPAVSENLALQTPEFDVDLEQKKRQAEKTKAELKKKEAQLAKKQREEEARQLQLAKKQQEAAQAKELEKEVQSEAAQHTTADAEESLNSEVAAEQEPSSSSQVAAQEGDLDKYKQMIIQTISRRWLIPETEDKELACTLLVHVGPGGVVVSVDVVKESGDPNLDRSARNAIMKASPLPVPENSELFDNFRALRLTFRPQGIISG